MPTDKESLFAEVSRKSQEKRAQSDRRAVTRRATETMEIAKQLAARKRDEKGNLPAAVSPAVSPAVDKPV